MRLCYWVIAMALFAMTACVDESFQIDKASSQVAIGGDITTLPLGYLEEKKLGDLISVEDLEGLKLDENGNYSLSFSGDGEEISIDGVENSFSIKKTMTTFVGNYPAFDLEGGNITIQQPFGITPNFGPLNIPQNTLVYIPAGYNISANASGVVSEELKYDVPEYLSSIKRIYFKPQASGQKGARVDMTLSLGDIATINGGGLISLELVINEGFEIYDLNGKELKPSSQQGGKCLYKIADGYSFSSGTSEIKFSAFVASVANTSTIVNNKLSLPVEMGYNIEFDLTTQANSLKLSNMPELKIGANLQFQDADIVLNDVAVLETGTLANAVTTINIDNLPKEVKSIKRVAFSGDSPIRFLMNGLDWLDDATAEHIIIEATLPEYLSLRDDKNLGYDAATHKLRISLKDLRRQVNLNLDALTFSGDGVAPKNGKLALDFAPDIAAHIEAGTEVKLSQILHGDKLEFSAGFDATTLKLVSLDGKIAYKYDESATIEMGSIDESLNLRIDNAGVLPIVTLNIENPLTLDAILSASLIPVSGGEAKSENGVAIDNVIIKAATVESGKIKPALTTLVLADESLRGNYASEQYTFVACNLGRILQGSLPEEVKFNVAFSTDENAVSSFYVADSYTVKYGYDVNIPLAFDDKLDITIEETIGDLSETFADLADQDISVKGVSLIAEVVNTIPVDFSFGAEVLDAQGRPTVASLNIPEGYNTIKGSADGKTEVTSTLRIGLDLGSSGNISQLADVDAIKLRFKALRSAEGSCALNAEQHISLKLKLELNGKINVDFGNI